MVTLVAQCVAKIELELLAHTNATANVTLDPVHLAILQEKKLAFAQKPHSLFHVLHRRQNPKNLAEIFVERSYWVVDAPVTENVMKESATIIAAERPNNSATVERNRN